MRTYRRYLLTVASLALLAAGGAASAAGQEHGERHDGRRHMQHMAGMHEGRDPASMVRHLGRKLDLDETQRQQIENITIAVRPEMDALRDRAAANREALHALDASDVNHDARLNDLAAEKGAIATEEALLHGRLRSQINAVLTAEQRQQLSEQAGKMRERYRKRQDRGPRVP